MKQDNDWAHFVKLTQRRFRKKFKKNITSKDIKKICDSFIQSVIDEVILGDKVQIDKHSTCQVIGTPVLEDKRLKSLLLKGKSFSGAGIRTARFNSMRKDFKYKIVYENTLSKNRLFFEPHKNFSRQVHEAIINTNNYYRIENGRR